MNTTPLLDYHTHTAFSTDGYSSIGKMAEAAASLGISQIAITDHYDPDYPLDGWGEEFSFDEYHKQLEKVQEEYKARISLVKGLEVGIQHGSTLRKCSESVNAYDYDFIIGSFHCAEGFELSCGGFFDGRSVEEATAAFYRYTYDCLSVYRDYDVLGHMNVIDRYGGYVPAYDDLMDIISEILKLIIYDGKGIEINTSSFRYGMGDHTTPSGEILKRYLELGGEIITVGSDAHSARDVGYGIKWAYEKMKSVGFRYVTAYCRRKPTFLSIV
ncbi:MAG TPA: histidinol-phosphatase HisJ family protein [Bacillota bacterium]|nr:histidinol-phosphatase HisJ family protein [Bacillota bacterium]